MKRLLLLSFLLLPGCDDDDRIIYGKIVDHEPAYYPYLTREERIDMKQKEERERYYDSHPQVSHHHTHTSLCYGSNNRCR